MFHSQPSFFMVPLLLPTFVHSLLLKQDKLIPVNPNKVPKLDEAELSKFPSGYRYLAYCQERTMGVKVLLDMPGHRRENGVPGGSPACGAKHDLLYMQCKQWVEGEDVDI